ncbi:glycosyltransferase [Patescibacteria group bacterium]
MKPKPTLAGKKILIIHFRVGRTDGVSLQISAYQEILKNKGATVKLCAGPFSKRADFVVKNLENQLDPNIFALNKQAFGGQKRFKNDDEFEKEFKRQQQILEKELIKVINKFRPDYLIVSNLFSVGENLSAAGALTRALDRSPVPTLAMNHDFYWEEVRYKKPAYKIIEKQLEEYFPPKRDFIKVACINSLAQKKLYKKKKIKSYLFPDTFNFDQPLWKKERFNNDILDDWGVKTNDLVILQATRIVRRKNIELAIDLVERLSQTDYLQKLASKTTYRQSQFNPNKNKLWLVLPGYAEREHENYLKSLLVYSKKKKVNLCLLTDRIGAYRINKASKKQYSLWDVYPFADIVTFPSGFEGFGNQFLEAVFAKKPVVVFEYPVFETDIKPKGFEIISLGDKKRFNSQGWVKLPKEKLEQATKEIYKILTSPKQYKQVTEKNFNLAKKLYSYKKAGRLLEKILLSLA